MPVGFVTTWTAVHSVDAPKGLREREGDVHAPSRLFPLLEIRR